VDRELTVREKIELADDWIAAVKRLNNKNKVTYLGRRRKDVNPVKWESIVHADGLDVCPLCGQPFCGKHQMHYADCPCIGPNEDDVIYHEDGFRARRIKNEQID